MYTIIKSVPQRNPHKRLIELLTGCSDPTRRSLNALLHSSHIHHDPEYINFPNSLDKIDSIEEIEVTISKE